MTGLNGSVQQITGKLMCFINSFIFIIQTYSVLRIQHQLRQIWSSSWPQNIQLKWRHGTIKQRWYNRNSENSKCSKETFPVWCSSNTDKVSWLKFEDCLGLRRWCKDYSVQRQIVRGKTEFKELKKKTRLAVDIEIIGRVLRHLGGNYDISHMVGEQRFGHGQFMYLIRECKKGNRFWRKGNKYSLGFWSEVAMRYSSGDIYFCYLD